MEEKILESIYSCYVTLGEIISEVRSVQAVEQAIRKSIERKLRKTRNK